METNKIEVTAKCLQHLQGIKDTQDVLTGKWKIIIVAALFYSGKMRFMDLLRHIGNVAPKVLSKELKDLEMNHLIKRTVCDTKPITVEYELSPLGESLHTILKEMGNWGIKYRDSLLGK